MKTDHTDNGINKEKTKLKQDSVGIQLKFVFFLATCYIQVQIQLHFSVSLVQQLPGPFSRLDV